MTQMTTNAASTENQLQAAMKMANAISRFHNRYTRGANIDEELDGMMKARDEFWDFWDAGTKTTEPNFSRENEEGSTK